ncbi:MAG: hypothetical protein LBC18_13395 [Opitutaceae bacterium]|jgi:hypothetical protein|nr:hypothetical protein [Opitutaceae bacterium]
MQLIPLTVNKLMKRPGIPGETAQHFLDSPCHSWLPPQTFPAGDSGDGTTVRIPKIAGLKK